MSKEMLSEELREFLLSKSDTEEFDYVNHVAPCYGMSWDKKKSHWIIRIDNKRVTEVNADDFPGFDVRSPEFVSHVLAILKDGGVDGLKLHIEELKCAT
jgi:hypothetical protein